MITEELRGFLAEVPPIPGYLKAYLFKVGTLTGSHVFGGFNSKDSDIDVLLHPKVSEKQFYGYLCYLGNECGRETFTSFYVKTEDGEVLNLLFMRSWGEFNRQVWATEKMVKDVYKGVCYVDKDIRVAAYKKYKEQWKTGG